MIFLDINTFFGDKAGGIRTYHLAKINWFKEHPEHRYIIVGPGKSRKREALAPNIERVWVKGLPLSRDSEGYRLLYDLLGVLKEIRKEKPDVVECGDPWISTPLLLFLRRTGVSIPLLSSFYHADPVRTYITPWAEKGGAVRKKVGRFADRLFYPLQRRHDVTLVSSRAMEQHLRERGVAVAHTPFGAPLSFIERGEERLSAYRRSETIKLFYAGRLDSEKGVDLLLAAIPKILSDERFELLILGRGKREAEFSRPEWLAHPRYQQVGYISDRTELLNLLASQELLLSSCPWETFGLGVLEAFALGIPAVAPDSGGAGELVEELDRRALYSAPPSGRYDNPDALLNAVNRVVDAGVESLGLRARAVAQRYGSWNNAVERMVGCYQKLLLEKVG